MQTKQISRSTGRGRRQHWQFVPPRSQLVAAQAQLYTTAELDGATVQLDAMLGHAYDEMGGTVLLTIDLTRHVVREAIANKASVVVAYRTWRCCGRADRACVGEC